MLYTLVLPSLADPPPVPVPACACQDEENASSATWGLSHLASGPQDVVAALVDLGVIPALVVQLGRGVAKTDEPVVSALAALAMNGPPDVVPQALMDAGVLPLALAPLQRHSQNSRLVLSVLKLIAAVAVRGASMARLKVCGVSAPAYPNGVTWQL